MDVCVKDFNNLSDIERKKICTERNKERIRSKMYNTDVISFEDHLKWLESLKNRNDCKYYLVIFDEIPIAVINYVNIKNGTCELGSYIFDQYLNSGYGLPMGVIHIDLAFNKLKLNKIHCSVLEDNKNAYNMNVKIFGYKKDDNYSSVQEKNGCLKKFNGLSMCHDDWVAWKESHLMKYLKYFNINYENIEFF